MNKEQAIAVTFINCGCREPERGRHDPDDLSRALRVARGGGENEKTASRSWDNRIKSVCKRISAE
jgi:hypothetical protein